MVRWYDILNLGSEVLILLDGINFLLNSMWKFFYINLSLAGLQLSAWIQILMLFQRPYPSTLGLIGTSKLACQESNAWRAGHDSESYTIARSQLLTSKWGWLPWLPSVYDFDKVSQFCLGLGSLSTRINIAAAKWTNMAWPIRLLILYVHK